MVGFAITIATVIKSRKSADAATEAANRVRSDLRKFKTVADFASALAVMEEIKRLHRANAVELLPDRYASLRKSLIGSRTSNPLLAEADQIVIQAAISQFAALERQIDRELSARTTGLNFPKMNSAVSLQIDSLQDLLVRIRATIGDAK